MNIYIVWRFTTIQLHIPSTAVRVIYLSQTNKYMLESSDNVFGSLCRWSCLFTILCDLLLKQIFLLFGCILVEVNVETHLMFCAKCFLNKTMYTLTFIIYDLLSINPCGTFHTQTSCS